jgi:uncharacterized protein DUF6644
MHLKALFADIQHSVLATSIGRLPIGYGAAAQLAHIAGLLLLLASIVLVNFRLLGVGVVSQPIARLARSTEGFLLTGFALLASSGVFIFLPAASLYYRNRAFWVKMVLIVLAVIFQLFVQRWIRGKPPGRSVLDRPVAIASLVLWFAIGAAGRTIGFLN